MEYLMELQYGHASQAMPAPTQRREAGNDVLLSLFYLTMAIVITLIKAPQSYDNLGNDQADFFGAAILPAAGIVWAMYMAPQALQERRFYLSVYWLGFGALCVGLIYYSFLRLLSGC